MLVVFEDIQNKSCVFSYIFEPQYVYALCSQPISFSTNFCNCVDIHYRLTVSQRVWMIVTKNVYVLHSGPHALKCLLFDRVRPVSSDC